MTDKQKIEELISALETLKEDAEMALDGSWDVNTTEGKEGFEDQIELIDDTINKVKNDNRRN